MEDGSSAVVEQGENGVDDKALEVVGVGVCLEGRLVVVHLEEVDDVGPVGVLVGLIDLVAGFRPGLGHQFGQGLEDGVDVPFADGPFRSYHKTHSWSPMVGGVLVVPKSSVRVAEDGAAAESGSRPSAAAPKDTVAAAREV